MAKKYYGKKRLYEMIKATNRYDNLPELKDCEYKSRGEYKWLEFYLSDRLVSIFAIYDSLIGATSVTLHEFNLLCDGKKELSFRMRLVDPY